MHAKWGHREHELIVEIVEDFVVYFECLDNFLVRVLQRQASQI